MKKYMLYLYIVGMVFTLCLFTALILFDKRGIGKDDPARAYAFSTQEPGIAVIASEDIAVSGAICVNNETMIIYEYYYLGDGLSERTEESPPYFLLDKTRDYFERTFTDWEIIKFSDKEIILRKNIEGLSGQYYILGVHDGFVAVYYENEKNGTNLKEITDTPVKSLAEDEREKLGKGIRIKGDENLIRALEDYGS